MYKDVMLFVFIKSFVFKFAINDSCSNPTLTLTATSFYHVFDESWYHVMFWTNLNFRNTILETLESSFPKECFPAICSGIIY